MSRVKIVAAGAWTMAAPLIRMETDAVVPKGPFGVFSLPAWMRQVLNFRPLGIRPFGVTGGGSTDYAVDVGQTVTVTVTVTNASAAVEPYVLVVDWGDGSAQYNTGRVSPSVSSGQVQWTGITHAYSAAASSLKIQATVTDNFGGSGGAAKTIAVYSNVTCAPISGPTQIDAGVAGSWSCSASGGNGTQYQWSWGDGSTTGNDTVAGGGAAGSAGHTYASPGTYTITFSALDSQQAGCQTTLTVTVYPQPAVQESVG